jgi:parallel beta helix pectate lyase-like protein
MPRFILALISLTLVFCTPPAAAEEFPRTRIVDCSLGQTLTATLARVGPGDTILVRGTCSENVFISNGAGRFSGVTLDGQGTAVISGPDATLDTIEATGISAFTIKGLTITGGFDGLAANTMSQLSIDHVTVQNTGRHGIHIQRGSSMVAITNSTIQNNPQNGVIVNENSYARVGFGMGVGASQGDTGPCSILGNGGHGVRVQRASSARIYSSTISGNLSDGIHIESDSYAEVASNVIDGNAKNGVFVSENSVLHLGNATGAKNEDNPNTTVVANGVFGLTASWGAYVQGRLGTLTGVSGASSFTHGAVNNLTP